LQYGTHFKTYLLFTCPRSLPAVDTILFTTLYVHHVIWFLKTYLVLIIVHRQGIAEVSTFCLSRTYLYSQELRCTSSLQHEIYHIGYLCHTFFVYQHGIILHLFIHRLSQPISYIKRITNVNTSCVLF